MVEVLWLISDRISFHATKKARLECLGSEIQHYLVLLFGLVLRLAAVC